MLYGSAPYSVVPYAVALAVAAGGGVNVAPGVGVLTVTGFAPTVSTPRVVKPGVGSLTLAGFAVTVATPRNVKPGVGALTLAGFAATVATPRVVKPGLGALTLTGIAPAIATPRVVKPGVGVLTLTGFAATVQTPRVIKPGVGVLTLGGLAPTIAIGAAKTMLPGVGVLTLAGLAPTIQTPRVTLPGTGALSLAGFAPVVSVSSGGPASVTPGVGLLLVSGFAPDVLGDPATGNTGGIWIQRRAAKPQAPDRVTPPSVKKSRPATPKPQRIMVRVEPGTGVLALEGFAPSVSIGVSVGSIEGGASLRRSEGPGVLPSQRSNGISQPSDLDSQQTGQQTGDVVRIGTRGDSPVGSVGDPVRYVPSPDADRIQPIFTGYAPTVTVSQNQPPKKSRRAKAPASPYTSWTPADEESETEELLLLIGMLP